MGTHSPELSSTGDLADLRYVRNLFNNLSKKGQRDLKSINLEMTFLTAGTDETAQTPTEKDVFASCK